MMTPKKLALIVSVLLSGTPLFAQDRQAIVIANQSYENLSNVPQASTILGLSQDLRRANFTVSAFSNLDTRGMRRALDSLQNAISNGDETLVILTGQIAANSAGVWLLATDAASPSGLMPGDSALSVSALAELLSAAQSSAVLLVGSDVGAQLDAPQGVSVFSGDPASLARLVREQLLIEGRALSDIAQSAGRGVTADGYLPDTRAFLADKGTGTTLPNGITEADIEALFFAKAQQANSETAYRDFLNRYPSGAAANEARRLLADLTRSPADIARDIERDLSLSRSQRRTIQSDLTLLGFSTNGVDGIFGRGTRSAISRWQGATGLVTTGYLDNGQIALMQRQVVDVRQELERQDAAYWRETGRLGSVAGYRAYLDRYPEGIFADLAQQELAALTAAAEAQAWSQTVAIDTVEAYQSFLESYAQGVYAESARARIAELTPTGPSDTDIAESRAQEERAVANPIFRLLAEQRLAALGFNPGAIDGQFDDTTRGAILAYQQANELPPTGYLDVVSINRLLNN